MQQKYRLLLTFALLTIAYVGFSQYTSYSDYDWTNSVTITQTDLDTSNSSVIILWNQYHEYIYEKNLLQEYKTIHKRVKLVTHSGVDANNKVYIPLYEGDKAIKVKARVIKKDGSIQELKADEIKEAYDQESEIKYKFFAFEGVEVGCEIEFLYCVRHQPSLDGRIITIQTDVPILSFEHKYITPINLGFKFKSYNACPNVIIDTLIKDKNVYTISGSNMPRLKEEESSAHDANLQKYAVKLNSNTATGVKDVYSYGSFSSSIYDNCYNSLDPKEAKALKSLIKTIKPSSATEEATIRDVENYIKTNFIHHETNDVNKSNISFIAANKTFNNFGSLKLFTNLFKELNIEHEIVLTSNRFENTFDKEFECYAFLAEYLIYFPKIKKVMSPTDNFNRLGFPENKYVNNYGLFIKSVSMGDYNTGLGKIKFIQGAKYEENRDVLEINAHINTDFADSKIDIIRKMSGYLAADYQPYFDLIKDEDKLKEVKESLIKTIDKEGTIEKLDITNSDANSFGQRPLTVSATLKTDYFIENAGNKFLFKVGLLIGPQMELYKKEERKMPLELPACHSYKRTITFNIPSGFKIANIDQIKINEVFTKDGTETMIFVSDYKQENDKVTISIDEFYKEYSYPITDFEEYRRVANASANFNKVVLVFEKQ